MTHCYKSLLLTSIVALSCAAASAQPGDDYQLTKSVVANGGGKSADATYSIEGTIGQFAAGSDSSQPPYVFSAGFWQSFLTPTAASVSISGRVLSAKGKPAPGSRVILTNAGGSFARTSVTNSFGIYRFDGILAGQFYMLDVIAKGSHFEPRVVSVLDDIADLDLIIFEAANISPHNFATERPR